MSHLFGLIGMPGHLELLIIGAILVLLFGHRLPSIMGSLGASIKIFRKELTEDDSPEAVN